MHTAKMEVITHQKNNYGEAKTVYRSTTNRVNQMKKLSILINSALMLTATVTANAADDRYFERPLSDNGIYRQYAFRLTKSNGTIGLHTGKDYNNDQTTVVRAAGSGRISAKVFNGYGDHGFGNTLLMIHAVSGLGFSPIYSLYGHLANFSQGTDVGAYVSKGQRIGTMGATGAGSNNITHLHFEFKTTNTTSDRAGNQWGYIGDTSENDYSQLENAGYRNPAAIIGNTAATYHDFRLANGLPSWSYRSKGVTWSATITNVFTATATYDARLILETLSGSLVGVIGEISNRTAKPGISDTLLFSKTSFSTPAGAYQIRLQHRGSALKGDWTTTPTPSGGVNPIMFTLY